MYTIYNFSDARVTSRAYSRNDTLYFSFSVTVTENAHMNLVTDAKTPYLILSERSAPIGAQRCARPWN